MTAPLTPPESDLQDFPFMPLHVARLRDSDLAAEEPPEACWYAVLLWAASWHQLPAGSLPDNDAILARLIGLGRDVRTFRKHRTSALRGFVTCDDGRLYHPVVAEQVVAAWSSKLQQRWRTECARIKKANQRNGTDLPQPTLEEFLSSGITAPRPDVVPGDSGPCPSGQSVQETGTGTEIGTERPKVSLPPTGAGEPDWAVRLEQAKALGGPGIDLTSPAMHTYRDLRGLCEPTTGEPCEWGEVLDAIQHEATKAAQKGKPIRTWAWVTERALTFRDRRLAGLPAPRSNRPLAATCPMGEDWPDTRWAVAVELWRADGSWEPRLGPTPGQPGCRVPPSLLIQTTHGSAA